MQVTIKRLNIGSVFKVGVVVNGLVFLVFGLLFFILPVLFFAGASTATINDAELRGAADFFGALSLISFLCFYLGGVIVAGIFGGFYFAVLAWLYNLASGWFGGLEVELLASRDGILDEIEQDIAEARSKRRL
ncbi:MAG: hypothetical protein SF162_08625 [bacterium]|nr:hypothetical protein [bacterium]